MDQKSELTISFDGLKGLDATLAAEELQQAIQALGESDLTVETKKERAETQDFGCRTERRSIFEQRIQRNVVSLAERVRFEIIRPGHQTVSK